MEGIWGVADVDADEEEDTDEGADEEEDMSSSSQSSHASKFEVEGGVPRIIRVSGAGEDIINGTFQLLAMTRHVAKLPLPAGLVYASSAGTGTATGRGGALGWYPTIVVVAPPRKEEDRIAWMIQKRWRRRRCGQ